MQTQPAIPKLFAVFPGQGSQHVGMGKDLYENFSTAREVFEEASDAIHVNLKKLCFDGPESDLILTENTQPCLLTSSVAAFRVAEKEYGFRPSAVAGHSLGEYSALVSIRCLELGAAVQWVRERGAAMQKAVPSGEGSMAAIIGLEDAQVKHLCELTTQSTLEKRKINPPSLSVPAIVEPANFNSQGQVVIAGSADAVTEAIALLKSREEFKSGKAIPLSVSAPFHCQLMRPARDRMAELFSKAEPHHRPKALVAPYVSNRTGRLTHESSLVFEFLIEQVDHPVLWKQSVESLLHAEYAHSVEFGPGKVLSGLIKRISTQASKTCSLTAVSDTASIKNLSKTLEIATQTLSVS